MQEKKELRKEYKVRRKSLTQEQIDKKSREIVNRLLQLPIWEYSNYHIFLPIHKQKEVNTHFLMTALQGNDKNVILPSSDFANTEMKHFLLTDDTLIKENKIGIPEPQNGFHVSTDQIDVVFVPLLVFDKKGNRIGYGKGFYDRFLRACQENVLTIGLSYFEPEEEIPADPHDIKLDLCQTPKETYRFDGAKKVT